MPAHIADHNGTPTLLLDNQPTFPAALWVSPPLPDGHPDPDLIRSSAKAGIDLYAFDVGVVGTHPEWRGPRHDSPGHFDFTTVEARFGRMLELNPDARFHLRIQLEMGREAGRWWRERHPEECELDSDGHRTTQSFASSTWRAQAVEFLQAYIAHIQGLGLGDRILAYQTGAGHTGEWVKGLTAMRSACGDYSEPMQTRFRRWLRDTYSGDIAALREAWTDREATFESAKVPEAEAQLCALNGAFRDPVREGRVVDYYRNLAGLCADLIVTFNRTVKEASGGHALAGAFYGYLMELAWNAGYFGEGPDSTYATIQRSGHLGLRRVLESPHVDFLVSPYSYGFRGIGGHGPTMLPSESVRRSGKLILFEDDTRTCLAPPDAGFGRTDSLDDSVAVLKRNFAEVLTRGHGIWWLGATSHIGPAQEPAFGPLLRRFRELGTFGLHLDRAPRAEIGVVLDDESFYYQSPNNSLDRSLIYNQRLWGLPRLGAPFDTYLLDDVISERTPPCRLYIFLNAFHLNAHRRKALLRRLRGSGATALWIYAAGFMRETAEAAHVAELTGFRVGTGEHAWGQTAHITDFDHPITQNLPQDLSWGTDSPLAPLFHLEDAQARILGQVVYSQGRCRPGFGVKPRDGWTSIYCATPNLPSSLLRGIARFSGVHIYNDAGDVLYASRRILGVHTVSGGPRTFVLPERAEVVRDLFSSCDLARDSDRFSVDLFPRSTSLFYAGEREPLRQLNKSECI
jgi:hypothetical protein